MASAGGRTVRGGLVDLLERALDKGVVLQADVVVTLSGVPLLALNLRAALASVETMVRYGIMRDWLEGQGSWTSGPRAAEGDRECISCVQSSRAFSTSSRH